MALRLIRTTFAPATRSPAFTSRCFFVPFSSMIAKPYLGLAGNGSPEIDQERDILLRRCRRGGLLFRDRLGRRAEEVPLRDDPVGVRRFAECGRPPSAPSPAAAGAGRIWMS